MTHPHPKRSFVPQAVLTRTCKINTAGANVNTAGASINTVNIPINTAASTPIMNHPRPKSNAFKKDIHKVQGLLTDIMQARTVLSIQMLILLGSKILLLGIEQYQELMKGHVGDEAVHKELGDRMERAATTASSLEAEQDSGSGPRCQDTILGGVDAQTSIEVYTARPKLNNDSIKLVLLENPTIYTSLIQQFWETAFASTSENEEMEITATIDGRVRTITEASIRRHLKLEDSDGIPTLPNAKIFKQIALMGYAYDSDKLTFQKGHFSPQWRFVIHTILYCLSPKKTAWEQFSSNIATAIICLATNRTFNFSKMIFEEGFPRVILEIPLFPTMLTAPESSPSRITSSPSLSPQTHISTSQQPPTPPFMQTIHDEEEHVTMPHDSSQPRVQSLGSDEGSLTLNALMVLYTTLSKKVEDLQNDLKQTKLTYGDAYTKLILRVKKLEHKVKASKSRRRTKIVVSDDEEVLEDSSK
ncbi:hypothetical protein Tco_1251937 [Tanacetum coccineum]